MSFSRYPEEFELDVARGLVKGTSHLHKFGANPQLANGAEGTVWDGGVIYPWSAFDTVTTAIISAVNVSDNGKTVTVQGLDQNYDFVEEDFVVSSAGGTTGSVQFKRINRAFVSAGTDNVGDIVL